MELAVICTHVTATPVSQATAAVPNTENVATQLHTVAPGANLAIQALDSVIVQNHRQPPQAQSRLLLVP